MIPKTYNIKPTMAMYNQYIANLNMRQSVKLTLPLMREGKHLCQSSYVAYRGALNASLLALEQARRVGDKHSARKLGSWSCNASSSAPACAGPATTTT